MKHMKKVSKFLMLIMCVTLLLSSSCKKGPGEGGQASIKGKVYAVNYNAAMTLPYDSGYLGRQKVYIIYGDETAVGDNQDSNPEGAFEFKYLRKGTYKVYVYTKVKQNCLDSAVVQPVEITEKKQTVELPLFKIKTSKN